MSADLYPHVRVSGSAFERGRQYGEQVPARVRGSVDAYAGVFERRAELGWDAARKLAAGYVPAIEAFDGQCLEEKQGIARGAGVDFEDILAINVRTEVMFSAKARAASGMRMVPAECSSLAVLPAASSNGHTLAAQNWDWLLHSRETVVVLEADQVDGPNFVSIVEAGCLAKFGVNSAGVCVLTNALISEQDMGEPAVPYHVLLRSLHDAVDLTDALGRIQNAHRASSANYLLASRDGLAVDVEALPGGFSDIFVQQPGDGLLMHANHFTSPHFVAPDVGLWAIPDSLFRLQSLRAFLKPLAGEITVPILRQALALHANHPSGVCSHPDERLDPLEQSATVASAVIDIDDRRMWIADGNPCTSGYRLVDYSTFLGP
jgi:isopenicillin-N N-acyltransferase like protein